MEFTSGPDEKITVKIDGVEYSLRQPLVGDLRKLANMGDLPGDKLIDETISFLVGIGMPEDKLNTLSMKTLIEIFTFVSTPKKSA
jgi:hypothetical protein